MSMQILKIGTRGSPLALKQTQMVCDALAQAAPDLQTEIVIIKTSGDWKPEDGETPLSENDGGKALFAKEIEQALLAGDIDCGVHSMKDMDSALPDGLTIPTMLPREDPRDVFLINDLANNSQKISDLPQGLKIGTTSVRRTAFLKALRPDLEAVPLRGNVQTRIDKMKSGQVDAIILACAGLRRLGLGDEISFVIEPDEILPAAGQGAVGIEIGPNWSKRDNSTEVIAAFSQLNCPQTLLCVTAERAVLSQINGSCHTPIGVYAILENTEMHLRAQLVALDGSRMFFEEARADVKTLEEAENLGRTLGRKLKAAAPPEIINPL